MLVVFHKEVVDNLRDRRSLVSALLYPLIGPALMLLLLLVVGRMLSDRPEEGFELAVAGAERAPGLVAFLEARGAEILPAPADPEAAAAAGELDVAIRIPEGYAEAFRAARPAPVALIFDASRNTAAVSVARARRLLDDYGREVGALRLQARGLSPDVAEALAIERVDVSTPQSQAASLLNLMPYFLIFSVFIGGMYLAIDTTAGERERGSLEPLLINPISRTQLVLGKLLATALFTVVSVTETLLVFALLLRAMPLEESLGLRLELDLGSLILIFLITLPMVFLAVPLQIDIATYTRSFKEAQNYLSLLPLVPALPGVFLAFSPLRPSPAMMLLPTFGQQILINRVLRGEAVPPGLVLLNAAVTLALGALLVALAVRLYRRERILFG